MQVNYLYPFWGSESFTAKEFFQTVKQNQFEGIEINIPENKNFITQFHQELELQRKYDSDFLLVTQQVLGVLKESPEDYINRVLRRLNTLVNYQPSFINSHTGKDHYSFDANCKIIEAIENFSTQHQIPIYHEIHRGRFTFHSATTLNYLEKFPNLKLVGDLSHWCVVSESMLLDQTEILNEIMPYIQHIHARVGFEQAPQVNHPFAPEWESHLNQFLIWWKQIIETHKTEKNFSITPEFGPFPYMPQAPYSQKPLSNQTELNVQLRKYLKQRL